MSDKGLPSLLNRHWAESVLAIGAIVIAAVSLWVVYDSQRSNRQIVASERQLVTENARPFVEQYYSTAILTGTDLVPKPKDQFFVTNAGVGPAKIETAELTWRGKAYRTWAALAHDCCGYPSSSVHVPIATSGIADSVLRPGQTVAVMGFPRVSTNSATWKSSRRPFRLFSSRFATAQYSISAGSRAARRCIRRRRRAVRPGRCRTPADVLRRS